jgi:hypothetical protein
LLRGARRGAAIGDEFFQKPREAGDDFGVFFGDVFLLGKIAVGNWLTVSRASGAAAGLVGYAYITYLRI